MKLNFTFHFSFFSLKLGFTRTQVPIRGAPRTWILQRHRAHLVSYSFRASPVHPNARHRNRSWRRFIHAQPRLGGCCPTERIQHSEIYLLTCSHQFDCTPHAL